MSYKVLYSKQAVKDWEKVKSNSVLARRVRSLVDIIAENPFANPPPFEKLTGQLLGLYSRRLNIQHRLVYEIREAEKVIAIYSMWTHYENT